MKKVFLKITIACCALLMFACSDVENVQYEGQEFVQIVDAPSSVGEDAGEFVVTLSLGLGSNPDGVTINYDINSDDPSRFNVTPSTGTVTIPAGEFTTDIVFEAVDDFDVNGDVDLEFVLSDSSDVAVGIGGEGVVDESVTITIIDNDCPVNTDAFIGTYTVEEVFTSGTNEGLALASAFGEAYRVQLAAQPGDLSGTRFVVTNVPGFNQFFVDGTVLTLFTCPGDVAISNNNIALFSNLTVEESSYDEENSVIVLAGPLGGFGPYEIVLTRT